MAHKGKTGRVVSEETKKKMSEAHKGKNTWSKGSKYNPNRIPHWLGKKFPIETREKISEALKGLTPWNKGKTASIETREKIRKAMIGRDNKRISQYDMNMNFIKTYISLTGASRESGIKISCIANNVTHRSRSAGKYIWKYV